MLDINDYYKNFSSVQPYKNADKTIFNTIL